MRLGRSPWSECIPAAMVNCNLESSNLENFWSEERMVLPFEIESRQKACGLADLDIPFKLILRRIPNLIQTDFLPRRPKWPSPATLFTTSTTCLQRLSFIPASCYPAQRPAPIFGAI